jgi:hypothetical protein
MKFLPLKNGGAIQLFGNELMYWEEKIDSLKSRFPQKDFRVPFTKWLAVFKSIETHFLLSDNANYKFKNWAERIKHKQFIKEIDKKHRKLELDKLVATQNYWVIIVFGDEPTAQQLICDCNKESMFALLSIAPSSFFVVHKKYEWLLFFECKDEKIKIYKNQHFKTPLDEQV